MTEVSDAKPSTPPTAWRYAKASRVHVVVDAAAYFALMQQAMLKARQRILLIGWDFDTRVRLGPGRRWWNRQDRAKYPARLGAFVVWLCKRNRALQIRVLKWNFGALKFIFRGTMIIDLIRWLFTPQIDFKFDAAHPLGCSHHQKIVVIDDRFAVCGGIDMTTARWDTSEHLHQDPRRKLPSLKPYGPWHDLTMMVEGEAASALGDLGRARWFDAGGGELEPCQPQNASPWPESLGAQFRDVEIGIARTRAAWREVPAITEVEALFVDRIGRARHFIYAENQYFASRVIAEAIAKRVSEPDPPEIVLVNPHSAEGWLEQAAMDGARVRLCHAIAENDSLGRFRIYIPFNAAGDPIYVHSKAMIVDDHFLQVGSSNMNNRSLGLDTECDLFIDAELPANAHAGPAIAELRHRLIAEHCGLAIKEVVAGLAQHGSMIGLIDSLSRTGKYLAPFELRPLTDTEKAIADQTLLDPEHPGELFEPFSTKRGLFRRGGFLRRPAEEKR